MCVCVRMWKYTFISVYVLAYNSCMKRLGISQTTKQLRKIVFRAAFEFVNLDAYQGQAVYVVVRIIRCTLYSHTKIDG
jgi:hypothetical protein